MTIPTTQLLPCDHSSITFSANDTLPTISDPETLASLQTASDHLLSQTSPLAFPTETVYGLGAPALSAPSVSQIFKTKGRPSDNPLIVHISSASMLPPLLAPAYSPPPIYEKLMNEFWPGPLTLLFPANAEVVPGIVTAGHKTVAVRMPSHPVARALIAMTGTPLAAPSANSSGKPSPTRATHVLNDLRIPYILDGGPCAVGLESTVVDGLHEDGHLRVLRPGGVTVEELERVVQEEGVGRKVLVHKRDYKDKAIEKAPTTPGMKYRHYAPSVPVVLFMTGTAPSDVEPQSLERTLSSMLGGHDTKLGVLAPADSLLPPRLDELQSRLNFTQHTFPLGRRDDPLTTAQRLFDGLLSLDREGVDMILIEGIEEEKEGLAVMNRVRKAAGETYWIRLG